MNSNNARVGIKKDLFNIFFLTLLYILQTVPLGLIGSLPYILTARKVSYSEQGTFSLAFWPFSLKLLWSPLVDVFYVKSFGRRKSWLVPIQYVIGAYMIYFSYVVQGILDNDKLDQGGSSSIFTLTVIFFVLAFMAATQDICVDGWALTMLSKENMSWSSTCESVGGTFGWFIGNVFFLVIESADFSNSYIRPYLGLENQSHGIVTIQSFMMFFGVLYLATTTVVLFFIKEINNHSEDDQLADYSLIDTYKVVWRIIKLGPILKLLLVLVTLRLSFSSEQMSYLKLISSGVPKEKLGLLAVPLTPLQIMLPFVISKKLSASDPFKFFTLSFIYRLILMVICAAWAYYTPYMQDTETKTYSFNYYVVCVVLEAFHSIAIYSTYIPMSIFFNRVTDKNIGATYITFLNTVSNLSRSLTNTGTLYLANFITFKECVVNADRFNEINSNRTDYEVLWNNINVNKCQNSVHIKACEDNGGECLVLFDAFYPLTVFGVFVGIFWLIKIRPILTSLQNEADSKWKVYLNKIKLK